MVVSAIAVDGKNVIQGAGSLKSSHGDKINRQCNGCLASSSDSYSSSISY